MEATNGFTDPMDSIGSSNHSNSGTPFEYEDTFNSILQPATGFVATSTSTPLSRASSSASSSAVVGQERSMLTIHGTAVPSRSNPPMTDTESDHFAAGFIRDALDTPLARQTDVTTDSLSTFLDVLAAKWTPTFTSTSLRAWAFSIFDAESDWHTLVDEEALKIVYNRWKYRLGHLLMHFEQLGVLSFDPLYQEVSLKVAKLLEILKHAKQLVLSDTRLRTRFREDYVPRDPPFSATLPSALRKDLKPHQEVLLDLMRAAQRRGYRRIENNVAVEIINDKGYSTHSWKIIKTVEEFVRETTDISNSAKKWKQSTDGKYTIRQYVEHLTTQPLPQYFPLVSPSRTVWSFRNGLYDGDTNSFWSYDSADIPSDLTACKYIDCNVDPTWLDCDIQDIKMGDQELLYHAILDDQGLKWAERRAVAIILGRLFFWAGKYDTWQVVPVLLGVAGSGKSTLATIMQSFYPKDRVGILSGKEETFFGEGLVDKWLNLCFEISQALSKIADQLLSIFINETANIARKKKSALMTKIKGPFLLCGNELLGNDKAGNWIRRLLCVFFKNRPPRPDTTLLRRLKNQRAAMAIFFCRAYHEGLQEYGNKSVIDAMPNYFQQVRRQVTASLNPIQSFFFRESRIFVYKSDKKIIDRIAMAEESGQSGRTQAPNIPYIPWELFVKMFSHHCRSHSLRTSPLLPENYGPVLEDHGIVRVRASNVPWVRPRTEQGRERTPGRGETVLPWDAVEIEHHTSGFYLLGVGLREYEDKYDAETLLLPALPRPEDVVQ